MASIKSPHRPKLPEEVDDEADSEHRAVSSLMVQCWAEKPEVRPSFAEIGKEMRTINKGRWVDVGAWGCQPVLLVYIAIAVSGIPNSFISIRVKLHIDFSSSWVTKYNCPFQRISFSV